MGMTIEEKFKVLTDEYAHLNGKYAMMQADYENRLKDDMVAMLTEIQLEIEDTGAYEQETQGKTEFLKGLDYSLNLIQQKINSLKENINK